MSSPLPQAKRRVWRRAWLIAALPLLGAIAWVYVRYYYPRKIAEPPAPSLAFADPAVIALIESTRNEVRQHPLDARTWGKFGMVLSLHGYDTEADECFRHAEQLDDTEPRWPYYRGVVLSNLDPPAAVAEFRRAVQLWGDKHTSPRLRLANHLLTLGQLDEASARFAAILENEPENAPAHLGLAQICCNRDDPKTALMHLEHCLADPGTDKPARILRAECLQRMGETQAAALERSLARRLPEIPLFRDPFMEEVMALQVGKRSRLARVEALASEGQMFEATTMILEILEDYQDNPDARLVLGRLLLRQGRPADAEKALRSVLEKQPGLVDGWFYLGGALLELGRPLEAEKKFRRAAELQPDYPEAYFNIGLSLTQQRKPAEAIPAYEQAVHYNPAYVRAHVELADLLIQMGRPADAQKHLELALRLDPEDKKARLLLEKVHEMLPAKR